MNEFPEIKKCSRFVSKHSVCYSQRFSKSLKYISDAVRAEIGDGSFYRAAGGVYAIVAMDKQPDSHNGIILSRSDRGSIANAPDSGIVCSSTIDGLEGKRVLVAVGLAPHMALENGVSIRVCGSICTFHDGVRPVSMPDDRIIPATIEEGENMIECIHPRGRNVLALRHVQEESSGGILLSASSNKRVVYEIVKVGPDVDTVSVGDFVLVHPSAVLPIDSMDNDKEKLSIIPEYGIISALNYEAELD